MQKRSIISIDILTLPIQLLTGRKKDGGAPLNGNFVICDRKQFTLSFVPNPNRFVFSLGGGTGTHSESISHMHRISRLRSQMLSQGHIGRTAVK